MKNQLSIFDVLYQMALTAVFHWWVAAEWTTSGYLERTGMTVPVALILVAAWRAWDERRAIKRRVIA